jgi:hypothetical protein
MKLEAHKVFIWENVSEMEHFENLPGVVEL